MLHIFYGNNVVGVRQKARDFLHKYDTNNAESIEVTPESFVSGLFKDLAGGVSLFGESQAIFIDTLSEAMEPFTEMLHDADILAGSPNAFVVVENTLTAETKERFKSAGAKLTEVKRDEKRFNTFALSDALLARDKKSLWILLNEAWRAGLASEEIIGALFWQIKMLRLAERVSCAEEAGMKPFVYSKAKRALVKFKEGEADRLSRELVILYHEGHSGKRDLSLALEQWVLKL